MNFKETDFDAVFRTTEYGNVYLDYRTNKKPEFYVRRNGVFMAIDSTYSSVTRCFWQPYNKWWIELGRFKYGK